jgi:hypothetical protein
VKVLRAEPSPTQAKIQSGEVPHTKIAPQQDVPQHGTLSPAPTLPSAIIVRGAYSEIEHLRLEGVGMQTTKSAHHVKLKDVTARPLTPTKTTAESGRKEAGNNVSGDNAPE